MRENKQLVGSVEEVTYGWEQPYREDKAKNGFWIKENVF